MIRIINVLHRGWMNVEQTAEAWGVTAGTIYALAENKTWKCIRRPAGMRGHESADRVVEIRRKNAVPNRVEAVA